MPQAPGHGGLGQGHAEAALGQVVAGAQEPLLLRGVDTREQVRGRREVGPRNGPALELEVGEELGAAELLTGRADQHHAVTGLLQLLGKYPATLKNNLDYSINKFTYFLYSF